MSGKRFWAIWVKRSLLSAFVIFLFGALIEFLMADASTGNDAFFGGLIALALYVAAVVLLGILNVISGAMYLWLFSKNDMVDSIIDDLRAVRLRPPGSHDPKTFDYLRELSQDEEAPVAERVKAAMLYGSYNAVMGVGLFRSLMMHKAIDSAILRYSQEAPQPRS
jgi:hypothetical protein